LQVLAWPAFAKADANPHAALLAAELRQLGVAIRDWTPWRALATPGPLWHIHLPETVLYRRSALLALVETAAFVLLLSLARWRGTRVVWTVHDLGSNDRWHPRLEAWYWRRYTARVDAVICLSREALRLARQRFPVLERRPGHVVPHGHYRGSYPSTLDPTEARRRLGLDATVPVILHFGLLRPYKNVPHLIATFGEAALPEAVLLIAGKPFDDRVRAEVEAAAANVPGVCLELRYIRSDEVQLFFLAADLVVLPYQRILNSGAALLALSFARPVLVPRMGSMVEHAADFGDDWVRLYDDELGADDLRAALAWARTGERGQPDIDHLDWGNLARQTKLIYEGL
jgi:glycosyltransferase involved in cell wall biosynthesis